MSELTEFLLARIAEDEAVANRGWNLASSRFGLIDLSEYADVLVADPSHVLAECAAKRQIVNVAQYAPEGADGWGYRKILRALAAIYADHPDYRAEWVL